MSAVKSTQKPRIAIARTAREIQKCHAVMRELRPKFERAEDFVAQVRRQQKQGYQIAFVEDDDKVRAVAGYRYLESLFSGKFLYLDDLVTRGEDRSRGFGGDLLDWLFDAAVARGCARLELDSGVQRADAHRFYFSKRMAITSFHFGRSLDSEKRRPGNKQRPALVRPRTLQRSATLLAGLEASQGTAGLANYGPPKKGPSRPNRRREGE
jgi:GNAT superfamily N-acetyltransferase